MSLPTAAAPDQESCAHCLLDRDGTVLAAESAQRPFYAASTIKLHVLLAALQLAERGGLDLDELVPARRTFTGADGAPFTLGGDHLDPTHPAEGTPVRVRELLQRMIDRSSNEATDHVLALIGLPAVTETIRGLGLTTTRVERLIGDPGALAAGATNETGAEDLSRTMLAAVCGATRTDATSPLLTTASLDLVRAALRAQQIPVITTALRPGLDHGSKSGWVDGYRHDVAFIGDPDGEELRVLAVMTAGLGPEAADRRIRQRVRELLPDLVT
ncbi:serine hydrolase [Brachybacterium sp.]|uniref:serine hydrolase n=1 Tax=Brachybacterium sp. TaxID=1891286 RepID=UPI002ECFB9C2